MYKQCTTEKAAMQQRRIEECLLTLMRDKSFHDISVSSLCERAGLSRKTFYCLFDSKHDVLCALIDRIIREFIHYRLPKESLAPNVPEELLAFFSYWLEQRPLLDALSKNGISTLLFERCIHHVMEEDAALLIQAGVTTSLQQNTEAMMFFLSGILTLVVGWHHTGYQKSPLEMARITDKLLAEPPIRHPGFM